QNKFSRSFNTTLDAINNTSLIRCCYDPLKPPMGFETSLWRKEKHPRLELPALLRQPPLSDFRAS
ncbi:hypothetical protein, partial [Cryobacterium sp. TmT3-12]|uniref:hypothetical protein n=1 Tax=Cryobacterium sp. TmT3-12 TaxID=1259266 RepID=UPI001A7E115D